MDAEHLVGDAEAEVLDEAAFPGPLGDGVGEAPGGPGAFAEHGTDASLREVARRTGVNIATRCRHFPTREALLEALLRHAFDTLRARAAGLLAAPGPGQALVTWIRELTVASARYDGLPASVMGALNDPSSTLHASCAGLRAAAGDLLARAQKSGQIRADLKAGELLATVYAMAWAAGQAARAGDAENRFLELLMALAMVLTRVVAMAIRGRAVTRQAAPTAIPAPGSGPHRVAPSWYAGTVCGIRCRQCGGSCRPGRGTSRRDHGQPQAGPARRAGTSAGQPPAAARPALSVPRPVATVGTAQWSR